MNDDKVEILIVDDEQGIVDLLGQVLELGGYAVRPVSSGQAALQTAQAALPDLILLDLAMPVMDGFETCRRLKANPATKDVPVIFITGQSEIEKVVQGFELGAVDYITKPFNTTELLRRVSTHIELYQLQRRLAREVEVKTDEVQDAQEHMERANQVYSSFVPREFLTLLQRDNILDVQLGDQVQTEMCVLFSDIIAFTSLSEKMGPEHCFRFINAYLSWISPIIRMNKGFIEKYIGDSIMALFPTEADDAVEAAVAMQKAMAQFNEKFIAPGTPSVQIGVGVHVDELMLGVIGESQRMETTVVSDAVNVASRLERLTRRYDVGLVVSEHVMNKLTTRDQYKFRVLDKVQFKGHNEPLVVYEIFEGDPDALIKRKLGTQADYEEALRLYYDRKFTQANLLIAQALAQDPDDRVLQYHQERIAEAVARGVPDDWTGVEVLVGEE
ncbi:MAG TPA: adenylate/guanylate cyclase domain-containing response regulator [Candidatus Latescibacteria bacterium]|nr:adenylate/guanylate cyclase domain-containing response regulator [Candidatus Latescibacterota bacterium]